MFRVAANVILADRGEDAISAEDALKRLNDHNFNSESALEEIQNPKPPSPPPAPPKVS